MFGEITEGKRMYVGKDLRKTVFHGSGGGGLLL
jgi:hypothetical protein